MATKIPIGSTAYLVSFVDGQGGGASDYIAYAEDLDTNFLLLRQTQNQVIDEVSALSGPNAIAAIDAFLWDDDDNPIQTTNEGVVGAGSYETSIVGGTLTVKKGQAYILGQRAELIGDLVGLESSGSTGTRFVALDQNGAVFITDGADQKALDVASVFWTGPSGPFSGAITQLAPVLFDGDGWAELRDRPASGATFPAQVFRRVSERIEDIEAAISGVVGPSPLVVPGGVFTAPGMVFEDGVGGADTTTGWFRPGANLWAWSASAVEVLRLLSDGILLAPDGSAGTPVVRSGTGVGLFFPSAGAAAALAAGSVELLRVESSQVLVGLIGSQGTPSLSVIGDTNTGFFFPAAGDELAVTLAGTQRLRWAGDQTLAEDGVVGGPAYSFDAEGDTGMYRAGTDRLAFATGGVLRAELDAEGNLDLPTNMGAIVKRVAQQTAILTATPTAIAWDNDAERDVGGWITPTSTDLTVPTGGDGLYLITFSVEWATETNGERQIHIEADAVTLDPVREEALAVGDNKQATSSVVALVATDVVRGIVEHTVGGNHEVDGARLAIQKIA